MATVDSAAGAEQFSEFFILRTFRAVKQGMMAPFMDALTWQAAWLRHFFNWDRVVVGYSLTGIPESVLEVYAIPETDKAGVEKRLQLLHEQDEYKALRKCCDDSKVDQGSQEELLPAMEYKTFLRDFVIKRRKQLGLCYAQVADAAARKANAEAEHKKQEEQFKVEIVDERKKLLDRRAVLNKQIEKLKKEIAEAEKIDTAPRFLGARENLSQTKKDLEDTEEKLSKTNRDLVQLSAKEDDMQKQLSRMAGEVKKSEREMQEAQLQASSKKRFVDVRIPAYFLNDTIKVRPEQLATYSAGMKELLEDFKWDFLAAGQVPPSPLAPNEDEIMHLWRFGDANALYQQMVELRENPRFDSLQKMTMNETQMLMCEWEALSKTKRLPLFEEEER